MQLFIEDDLRDSGAVAQINKDQLAQVAAAMHPAHQDHVFIGVGCAQAAAVVGAFQVSESIEQDCVPFRLLRLPQQSDAGDALSAPRAALFGFQIF